ncbi:hypothetical protein PtA15_11A256 [Puccinia triticina]|uniref:Uncharacterized protein n=1 Tax=Puccinia triticina TaxID=208348 RepID=A0ABY7CWG8_9BASI|nr:uncharacterized protein PtA15_11A256 [Puccinia triticina]WAQ89566.1 hypothetical protein PtA15_11A256 [Puccinia triticina]
MTVPLLTPQNPANTGAATVTAFPFSKARMRYKEDRRPTIPEPLKDEFLLDLLAPAEAHFHANPGGVSKPPCYQSTQPSHMLGMHGSAYANLAMPDADVLTALGGRFDDRWSISPSLQPQPITLSTQPIPRQSLFFSIIIHQAPQPTRPCQQCTELIGPSRPPARSRLPFSVVTLAVQDPVGVVSDAEQGDDNSRVDPA